MLVVTLVAAALPGVARGFTVSKSDSPDPVVPGNYALINRSDTFTLRVTVSLSAPPGTIISNSVTFGPGTGAGQTTTAIRTVSGRRIRASRRLIPLASGSAYAFVDAAPVSRLATNYYLQAIAFDGSRRWYGPARVRRAQR